jgi:hypothetical protein
LQKLGLDIYKENVMAKYILKCVDDTNDALGATVTYEFEAEEMTNITYHLAQFLRSAGFTWVDDVEVVKDNFLDDPDAPADDIIDDSMVLDDNYDNMSVSHDKDTK